MEHTGKGRPHQERNRQNPPQSAIRYRDKRFFNRVKIFKIQVKRQHIIKCVGGGVSYKVTSISCLSITSFNFRSPVSGVPIFLEDDSCVCESVG